MAPCDGGGCRGSGRSAAGASATGRNDAAGSSCTRQLVARVARRVPRHLGLAGRRCGRPDCLSLRRVSVHHVPDRSAGTRARSDRVVADVSRRLRRHDFTGADDGGGHCRLRRCDSRRKQRHRNQPELAVVAGRAVCGADSYRVCRGHRVALGTNRRHLHDHDHARDRRRLFLSSAAELQPVQWVAGFAKGASADRIRRELA